MLITTNANFIQETIEIFGFIITIVLAIMFIVMIRNRKKSEKLLVFLLFLTGFNLLFDAIWYAVDGTPGHIARFVHETVIILEYIDNSLMLISITGYIKNVIEENGGTFNNGFTHAVGTLGGLIMMLPVSNLFFRWMYFIDDTNTYQRLAGWYSYPVLIALAMIVLLSMLIRHRRELSKSKRYTLYFLLLAPFIGMALQTLIYGISFIQLGIALGALVAVGGYVTDWVFSERKQNDGGGQRHHFWIIEGVFLLMIVFITAAVASNVISISKVSLQESEQTSRTVAHMVSGTINTVIGEPINVSRTMAQTAVVRDALRMGNITGTDEEAKLVSFMKNLKAEYGFEDVFAISDDTLACYTDEGFNRYIGKADQWYKDFNKRNNDYKFNVDSEIDGDGMQTIFINMEVKDDNGHRIGVCGVGTHVSKLAEVLADYEGEYNLDIYMVDQNGSIRVKADEKLSRNEIIDVTNLNEYGGNNFSYKRTGSKAVLTKYVDEMGWYLVIEDNKPDKIEGMKVVTPSLIIYAIGIILIIIITLLFGSYERKRNRALFATRRQAETDALTGLLNRHSMENFIENLEKNGLPECLALAMFDVNGLKEANDNIGHMAGDELLTGTADCICEVFAPYGNMYRIGGDEFLVICQCDDDKVNSLMQEFKEKVSQWEGEQVKELAVSIGWTSRHQFPEYSVEQLRREADLMMYQMKGEYYNQAGKNRRRSDR